MPKLIAYEIRNLIDRRDIRFISVDTSIFEQKRNRLEKQPLLSLEQFCKTDIQFVLCEVIYSELKSHMLRNQKADIERLEIAIAKIQEHWPGTGPTFPALDDSKYPPIKEIISDMVIREIGESNVDDRFQAFLNMSRCLIIPLEKENLSGYVFDLYFKNLPPFQKIKNQSFQMHSHLLPLNIFQDLSEL